MHRIEEETAKQEKQKYNTDSTYQVPSIVLISSFSPADMNIKVQTKHTLGPIAINLSLDFSNRCHVLVFLMCLCIFCHIAEKKYKLKCQLRQ